MRLQRVLVTGGTGQLGSDVASALAGATVFAPGRGELDVTDTTGVDRVLEELRPDTVINCAAFHNLDVCEREEGTSFAVNATAVKRLAERADAAGAKLVHLSTNYVFDGRSKEPYREDARPAPRSVYAISKLAGEHAALAYSADALVVRTAGLYGVHGSASKGGNFVQRMVTRAKEQGGLRMVADQRLSPTFTRDLAEALVEAVRAEATGVLHLTADGSCSWHEFTVAIMNIAGVDVPVAPVATAPGGIDRPLNGVLARSAADALGLAPLRHWHEALADYMQQAGLSARS